MLILKILVVLALSSAEVRAEDLLLTNAQIIDPANKTLTNSNLVLSDGKIKEVLKSIPSTFQGKTVDAQGKWVIPGLSDMHTHAFGNLGPGNTYQYLGAGETSQVMLYSGVTSFLDLFYPEDEIFKERNDQRSNPNFTGAEIFAAGPIFTCTGGHGTEYSVPTRVINSPEQARREISALALKHPDVIKIVYDHARARPSIDQATMEAAVKTSSELGLKTVIHIGTWQDAKEAVLAGATVITHLYEQDIPDDLVALFKQRNTWLIPTMTVQSEFFNLTENSALLTAPLLKGVTSASLLDAYAKADLNQDAAAKFWYGWQKSGRDSYRRTLEKLHQAGIHIMTGTDSGNLGTFQGYSLHREMAILVQAGFSTWEALASATTLPGEFLGRRHCVAAGCLANLVLLNKNPIDDITNTQDIAEVILNGRLIERNSLVKPSAFATNAKPKFFHGGGH